MKRIVAGIAFLVCLAVFVQSAHSYRLTDNLYFAMQNDTIECIDIILPDDSNFMGLGEWEYKIVCTSNWSDLTEQIVRTDENNTVKIPICFSGFGRSIGECSPPFTISIQSSLLGIENNRTGGVCISMYPDVDITDEEAEDEDDVRDILNGEFDLFDVGLSPERLHSEPGQSLTYNLLVQSQAEITIDLDIVSSDLSISPRSRTVTTSESDPYHTIYLSLDAPGQNGEYEFEVEANVRNCEGMYCSKTAKGILVVNDTLPETGFVVYIFPSGINVKELNPVHYMLTIQNYGKDRIFSASIKIDPDTTNDFPSDDIFVVADTHKAIDFTITPNKVSTLYNIDVTVSFEGLLEKKASTTLSTNEMLTDSLRDADYLKDQDPSLSGDVDTSLDDWYNSYRNSDYGGDLGDYNSLKDAFSNLEDQINTSQPPDDNGDDYIPDDYIPDDYQEEDPMAWLWSILPIIIIVVAAVVIVIVMLKKSKSTEEVEERYF